jgi:glycosyltransferase involved in cell wall biosynthesis
MKKILFVHIDGKNLSTFAKRDIEILRKKYSVKVLNYNRVRDAYKILLQCLNSHATFCWFAWDHAAWGVRFSRLLGKKSVVIVGGFGVVNMPEINYGNMLNETNAKRTIYALRNASQVLAVSKSLRDDANKYCERDIPVVYHGFDYNKFVPGGKKDPIVITVGQINKSNLQRKGLETFVKAASYLKDVQFYLIGGYDETTLDYLKGFATPNITFTGFVGKEELLEYLQRAQVYLQVSSHEGFGCSLAEAMLCECLPVVTECGAIPEVVGETGYYVPFDDPKATADGIKQALQDSEKGKEARERIKTHFPLEKREKELIGWVEKALGN